MVASAGSSQRKIDEVSKALFPMAGSFNEQVDKEVTTVTGSTHQILVENSYHLHYDSLSASVISAMRGPAPSIGRLGTSCAP